VRRGSNIGIRVDIVKGVPPVFTPAGFVEEKLRRPRRLVDEFRRLQFLSPPVRRPVPGICGR
jgi:hypothetical protein